MKGEVWAITGRVRRVWPLLASSSVLDRTTVVPRMLPADRAAFLDELVRQERAERLDVLRWRTKPTGNQPGPVRMSILDARGLIDQVVSRYAPEIMRAAIGRPLRSAAASVDGRVASGLRVIDQLAWQLVDRESDGMLPIVVDMVDMLTVAVRVAEQIAGVDLYAETRPMSVDCPACGCRTLDRWPSGVVECSSEVCLCPAEAGCDCRRPVRVPGRRHYWAPDEWLSLLLAA